MLIETRRCTLEFSLFRALFIRIGTYEFSWDHNGYCLCRGLRTIIANWE